APEHRLQRPLLRGGGREFVLVRVTEGRIRCSRRLVAEPLHADAFCLLGRRIAGERACWDCWLTPEPASLSAVNPSALRRANALFCPPQRGWESNGTRIPSL